MIPVNRPGIFEAALRVLQGFGEHTSIRGRFVLLYLSMRRMGDELAGLGSSSPTPANQIEEFSDRLYEKSHRPEPLVVLTAAFGQSTSPNAPWSTRTGDTAPANRYPTNTWRNNFNIQKGIGCPADRETINQILRNPLVRLSCPHMMVDDEGRQMCGISGTVYRGDEHSVWLQADGGYRVVDLDNPSVYETYLISQGRHIPVFPLIAVLYCYAPSAIYPVRDIVGIPEFAEDFNFTVDQVIQLFDCDPDSPENAEVLALASGTALSTPEPQPQLPNAQPLPDEPEPALLNTGVGAELEVARNLQAHNWSVIYTGNVRYLGYDLEATQNGQTLRVEVKSSIGLCTPELTEEEWSAAQRYEDESVLAIVDFFGSPGQRISYVRNPAANVIPAMRQVTLFRVSRQDVTALSVDAEFL